MVARPPHSGLVPVQRTTTGRPAAPPPLNATTSSDSTLRAVVEAALHPIVTIDSDGIVLSASNSLERVFGWTPAQLVGQNISVLMPAPHRDAHNGYLERYRQTSETTILNRPRRFDALHKNGTIFPIELSVSYADTPTGDSRVFVGIIRDLSDQVSAEQRDALDHDRLENLVSQQTQALQDAHLRLRLADRMASIGTLAAGLGHDMKNVLLPVRAHLNALGAARDDLDPAHRREHVEKILKGVAYLQQLADGLHFLIMDPEKEDEDQSSTFLQSWWLQTGTLIAKAVPKHVRVTVSFPPDLPEVAVAAHRLTQAVLNLVVNAGEAIPVHRKRRQGTVRVSGRVSADRKWVTLVVADNGNGMTEEVKRRAFEVFFTTKPRDLGTGLGLALVRKAIERSGGDIEIDSTPGKGSRMIMTLPALARCALPTDAPNAVVTVADNRAESLICQLLDGAGAQVHLEPNPAHTDIWVLDLVEERLSEARKWRRAHPDGQLVLLHKADTPQSHQWDSLSPLIIKDRNDFEEVRTALRCAVAAV